jgi:glycosyltransferase involved in cell wall biosynthesis
MSLRIRLTVVLTHPVQYYAPWFRHIAERCPEIDLTVLYAIEPTPEQQGVGFARSFLWDVPLTAGYRYRVLRAARPQDDVHSSSFRGVDVPWVGEEVLATRPDVVLIPGWHSISLLRAARACRRAGVPVLYRGDSNLAAAPGGTFAPLWRLRTRRRLGLFAAYLSTGRRSREYLAAFGLPAERIFDSPHAVDNDFFAAQAAPLATAAARRRLRREFGLDGGFVVLFVGKLTPAKRPLDLLHAMALLAPGASLLVVGSGPLERVCRAAAEKLGVRVAWAGFRNQSELGSAYAAADCLALPSGIETWGLVVNEAMASGLPCVVSDRVGCAPDLVLPGATGEVFPAGDAAALAAALGRLRRRIEAGTDLARACRERAAAHSYAAATAGLLAGCRAVAGRRTAVGRRRGAPRVLACCGGMVIVAGLERLTFEVLRVLHERGAAVHCILNSWENHRIVPLVEGIGASWSIGAYRATLERHTLHPVKLLRMAWDVLATSAGLLADARHFRPTHVLLPEFMAVLRNAPALALLRALGVPAVLRVANAPEAGRFYALLWRRVLPPLVTLFVANSEFGARRLREVGVPARKVAVVRNAVSRRAVAPGTDREVVTLVRSRRTVLSVGQIAPFKGTHLVVAAVLALLDLGYDVQGVIVGRRPEWPPEYAGYAADLERQVAAAGRGGSLHFVGEREDVPAIMREAYVLAVPILQQETFGNVVLEAKSAGLPAVAFAHGGLPELVRHGVDGYLCPEPTLAGLLAGLRFYLDDPAARARAGEAALAELARPGQELAAAAFAGRWWALFTGEWT